ncbi:MAG: tRNA (adenosine(37)-N6)-threonylcarbamoyltransferase complex ATPase subunit type 1 TsaE [Planctomycetota bacterium]
MKIERLCHSEQETMALAAWLGRQLTGGEVICLEGPLGCGKTQFVRGLAAGLGLDPSAVCSPSFIICREHANHAPVGLAHVDAYRLDGAADLEAVGWDELLGAPDTVIAVEWASRIQPALPARRIEVAMEHVAPTARLITLTAPPELASGWEPLDE